eukprot:m.68102 g.68102  ORF g.68102 m.68102 type:complete len:320 (+) comp9901_c0_seq1:92-1051(+)
MGGVGDAGAAAAPAGPPRHKVIEWAHLDKRKYFLYGPALNVVTNAILYPTKLVKVRMQAHHGSEGRYRSVLHAFQSIVRKEGAASLYKGFGVNSFSVVSSQLYITAYEVFRAWGRGRGHTEAVSNLGAGVAASAIQQAIAVPVDVVSQRLMVDRRRDGAKTPRAVVRGILATDGVMGFWKGSAASLLTLAPTSGIFWASYGVLRRVQISWHDPQAQPGFTKTLAEQAAASWLAGCFSAMCTNPLDIVKTRIQVNAKQGGAVSIASAFRTLVREDGVWLVTKGLQARMLHMSFNSVILMTVYETVKYYSVLSPPVGQDPT